MRRGIKSLIILFVLLITVQSGFCYVLSKDEIQRYILSKVNNQYKTLLAPYSTDYKITIQGIPDEKIITAENTMPKIELKAQNQDFEPNSYRRVIIKNSKGQILKCFAINVQTKVYGNVLTAAKTIGFNQEINAENTKITRSEITRHLKNTLKTLPDNCVAGRNYTQGSIIPADSIKEKALISKNSSVDIKFLSKTLEIRTRGKALKDGALGETILVKSDKYNKTYSAVVNSSSEVIVRI